MTRHTYPIIGTKSSLLWDEETDAWVYVAGAPERKDTPQSYYKIIPTLYRGVDKRAKAISSLPWALMRGEDEYDTSSNYQNRAGLVNNMTIMLYLIEASLVLAGAAYWKREKNPAGYDKIRHLDPSSLTLIDAQARQGKLAWKRYANNVEKTLTQDEIIYIWYPDPYVEIGPPSAWPAQAALFACGALANMDEFVKSFFGRGAIKAMIFAMSGAPREEAERFETWWNKFVAGIKNAFRTKVINAEKVEPVVVGEGIKELENVTVAQEKREEVARALDIPLSILFANAANYATAERDKLNWYEDVIVPEANFIASVLNEQLFRPLGLQLVFKPETLDIFQEDEEQRAGAMSAFMDALNKAESLEMARALFIIYGVEIPNDAMALIEQHYKDKAARYALIQEQTRPAEEQAEPVEEQANIQPVNEERIVEQDKNVDLPRLGRELSIWQSKCLAAIKRGEAAQSVAFIPLSIPAETYSSIVAGLERAATADEVKAVFSEATITPVPGYQSALALLAQELRRANDLLETSAR
jgi:hypothetical protein